MAYYTIDFSRVYVRGRVPSGHNYEGYWIVDIKDGAVVFTDEGNNARASDVNRLSVIQISLSEFTLSERDVYHGSHRRYFPLRDMPIVSAYTGNQLLVSGHFYQLIGLLIDLGMQSPTDVLKNHRDIYDILYQYVANQEGLREQKQSEEKMPPFCKGYTAKKAATFNRAATSNKASCNVSGESTVFRPKPVYPATVTAAFFSGDNSACLNNHPNTAVAPMEMS